MQGKLFARDFLQRGIVEEPLWQLLPPERVTGLATELAAIFQAALHAGELNEAATEQEIILPTLRLLGWEHVLPQQSLASRGREDVPDILLFPSAEHKRRALQARRDAERFRLGVAVVECKRWDRPLDRASPDAGGHGTPSSQMLRYLSRAEVASERRIRWGILTNGRLWRLYWQGARARAEEFCELDLVACLGLEQDAAGGGEVLEQQDPAHWLRVFCVLFSPQAFAPVPGDPENRCFLERAVGESRLWEGRVSSYLGEVVFLRVFPNLVQALGENDPQAQLHDPAYLAEVRNAGLVFLYRLLFVFYAEDRGLLPTHDARYDDYSLRVIRQDIAARVDAGDAFCASATRYFTHVADLCRVIAQGDPSLGVPAYDGGLFDAEAAPILGRVRLAAALFAPLLDALSRWQEREKKVWINYRDLSVQQLGSVYERLLEYDVSWEGGRLHLRPNPLARRVTGSYYTHDDLVHLLVSRTIGPLVEERRQAFRAKVEELAQDRRPVAQRLAELATWDPATSLLQLRVCDPAMGSGHFLVAVVDFLSDAVLEAAAEAEAAVFWASEEQPYRSPLAWRLEEARQRLLANARQQGWTVDPAQLDDRQLVRRLVLKRVIYGVDKNPMAVELAKVALWLHTFTVGAPLSFLDHHLRCGDSLYGEWLEAVAEELQQHRAALFLGGEREKLEAASRMFSTVAALEDADVAEVASSREFFAEARETLKPLWAFLDFWHGLRWLPPDKGQQAAVEAFLNGSFGSPLKVLERGKVEEEGQDQLARRLNLLLASIAELAETQRFFHWQLAFPEAFQAGEEAGFDVVLGNPPWDRVKLQEVEWFAVRRPEIARATRAADRRRMVQELEARHDPLWQEYEHARWIAETAARVARSCGQYPWLSGGDVNLYSLFVERASRLVKPQGMVGLLTPSGIAGDLSAAAFFREISGSGRLAALFDFENRRAFFPDVHASFKFCALVFGGAKRRFAKASCAFFLHRVGELTDDQRSFSLAPEDFRRVNPNTGTAPVFRTRRDAELVSRMYGRLPVVANRTSNPPALAWPFRYATMFHMTNDSHLFRTTAELEAEGFYRVEGNVYRRGDACYVPLYEGKMVQAYDHRAASVVVNPENVHRPGHPVAASQEEHTDPYWQPRPQYWVPKASVPSNDGWYLAFKDVTAPTNRRTMIAAIIPGVGVGNTLALLVPSAVQGALGIDAPTAAAVALANLNAFALDFVARQKVQGQHLNLYILEQLPVVPLARFSEKIGNKPILELVREHVLALSFTAFDLEPFARALGYHGEPFAWDEEDRRHRMAQLDALFFFLYGLSREEADYVCNQFPIVREEDEKALGRFLTRDLILAYMSALAAGDWRSRVRVG